MRARLFVGIFRIIVPVSILAAFLYYLYINAEKYSQLLKISKTSVLMLFVLCLVFPLLTSMQNVLVYRGLGLVKFSQFESFLITTASTLANQLPIPGGILSRGYYLKRIHNLSYTTYTSSTIALLFCYLAVNGLIGLCVLLYWIAISESSVPPILVIGFVLMMSSLVVFWIPVDQLWLPKTMHRWVHQAITGWTAIGRNRILILKLISLQTILVVLLSLRYWISFHMLSQNVTIGQTLLFACASILTQLVSIAPGGLGVREAIVAGVATTLGFDSGVSVLAVGLDRLVVTLVIVITGWISTVVLGKRISGTSINSVNQNE